MLIKQKAAMFGLDARIAMAIFGALSVIAGIALHGAVDKANVLSFVESLNQAGKGFEQYYINTRTLPPRYAEADKSAYTFYIFKSKFLVEKPAGVDRWKGPYLPYNPYSGVVSSPDLVWYLDFPIDFISNLFLSFVQLDDSLAFGGNDAGWTVAPCNTAGRQCSIWVSSGGHQDESFLIDVDNHVDGGDGNASGIFRWNYFPGGSYYTSYLKYMTFKNPNG